MLALVNPGSATIVGLQSTTYTHVGIGHTRLATQHVRNITNLALVARLLLELSHRSFFGALALVDQTGGKLDAVRVYWRPILQDDHRLRWLVGVAENWSNGDSVYTPFGTRLARCSFPDAVFAILVGPLT